MPMLGVHKEIKVQRPIASDELNIFYNSAGEAVWQIQYLEHAIVNFVVIKRHKRKPSSVKEAHERLETERKGTLGSLYGRAKDEGIIPDNLKPRFDKLISERNRSKQSTGYATFFFPHTPQMTIAQHYSENAIYKQLYSQIVFWQQTCLTRPN